MDRPALASSLNWLLIASLAARPKLQMFSGKNQCATSRPAALGKDVAIPIAGVTGDPTVGDGAIHSPLKVGVAHAAKVNALQGIAYRDFVRREHLQDLPRCLVVTRTCTQHLKFPVRPHNDNAGEGGEETTRLIPALCLWNSPRKKLSSSSACLLPATLVA